MANGPGALALNLAESIGRVEDRQVAALAGN
jgi:hypothetical protein